MARGKKSSRGSKELQVPIGIDGREYKLLLDPDVFAGKAPDKAAKNFWSRRLKPLIEETLGAPSNGQSRAEGELELKKQRIITFFDSKKHILHKNGFALRKRTTLKNGAPDGPPEVTLKFRTPDMLLAAEYCQAAKEGAGETTFEEDIAPLQVSRGKKGVAVPDPRATYSRFAVSTELTGDTSFGTLKDAFARFGSLRKTLERRAEAGVDPATKLLSGPTILELVFQEAFVDLGEKLDAEFGFTLWYFQKSAHEGNLWKDLTSGRLDPSVAEISFDFDTKNGRMDADAAERASKLFIAMQEELSGDPQEASKTELALP